MAGEQELLLVPVELNLEDFPLFVPRKAMRRGSYSFERVTEGEKGTHLHQKWTVISSSESDLPGIFDQDIFIGVLELLERRGGMPESGTLYFSLYELAEVLALEVGGKTYGQIRRSLERIALTSIRSENAFWIEGQKRFIMDTFRLWDITFDDSQNRKGEKRSRHRIEFGKLFVRSFRDHYLRGLDTELYWSLDSPVAKRLYRLIDHKRDESGVWSIELRELQEQIPMGPYRYPTKIREKLSGPHGELVSAGFLQQAEYLDNNLVRYEVAKAFLKQREGLELAGTREELIAIKLLTHSGLRGDVSRDLVASHGPEYCTRYANVLPLQKNLRNPAGWLKRAIEEGYLLESLPSPALFIEEASEEGTEDTGASAAAEPPTKEPAAEELLERALEYLDSSEETESIRYWFDEAIATDLDENTLFLCFPTPSAAEYIESRFKELIERALEAQLGQGARVYLSSYG